MALGYVPTEQLEVYLRSSALSGRVFRVAAKWDGFSRDTIGKQLVRATAAISANLVEGDARGTGRDTIRFFHIAWASAREARHFVQRAALRDLISASDGEALTQELTEIAEMINALIRHRRSELDTIKESRTPYQTDPSTTP